MPINRSLARALIKQYGREKAEQVYHAMERDDSPAFRKGLQTSARHGHLGDRFPRSGKRSDIIKRKLRGH